MAISFALTISSRIFLSTEQTSSSSSSPRILRPETGEYIIDPSTGKPLKDADGNVVMGEDGKPKKDPKTQTPYLQLDNLLEIEKLPDGPEKEKRLEAISPIRQMRIPGEKLIVFKLRSYGFDVKIINIVHEYHAVWVAH